MDIISQLQATADRTLPYFDLSEEDLARTYQPGKWPVRFLLHHLDDAETVLFDRIRRIISEPRQVLWAFDQDSSASGLDYSRKHKSGRLRCVVCGRTYCSCGGSGDDGVGAAW